MKKSDFIFLFELVYFRYSKIYLKGSSEFKCCERILHFLSDQFSYRYGYTIAYHLPTFIF